ncbi:short-chain dehydrogenase [Sorangium cellulosum]|uniref:Short-chain dehydrogenase n=1 Tax=Sorangium cellulosum TaxID=56 RepID=A0A2L0ERM4_SORCE|nr:SDR family oxidoreductase [Sorangium cellulosum]AUX41949.1 short-chain dehydrogenase [Sorangium cellulosum]
MQGSLKTALVTGAGKRIGRAIALGLARDGWAVAVHYHRSAAEAEAVVDAITGAGGKAAAVAADLRSEPETGSLVERAAGALGAALGCLINNASLFEFDAAETATRASWDAHMEVNLRAPFVLSQAFARQLPEAARGAIINVIDQRVLNLTPHFVSYTVSKSGLWTLTRTLAMALAPRIRVNGIGPGPALPSAYQEPDQFARQAARMPLGRGTTPEEITDAVRFLLSAPSITGQMLALDGGQHLGWAQPSTDDPVHD